MSEDSQSRAKRLLTLVPWLSANNGVTVAEASAHFGIPANLLIDDLRLLLVTGRPGQSLFSFVDIHFWSDQSIHEDDRDFDVPEDTRISVRNALGLSRPLRLDPDHIDEITEQLRLLAGAYGHASEAIVSALEKFELRLALHDHANVVTRPNASTAPRSRVRTLVKAAIDEGTCISIRYASDDHDEVTERSVQPIRMIVDADRTYIDAWCHLKGDRRMFRLDRIIGGGSSAVPPIDLSLVDFAPRPAQPSAGVVIEVRIERDGQWVLQEYPFVAITQEADGTCTAQLTVGGLDWAVGWCLQYAGFVTPLSPQLVVDETRARARSALQAYSKEVTGSSQGHDGTAAAITFAQ